MNRYTIHHRWNCISCIFIIFSVLCAFDIIKEQPCLYIVYAKPAPALITLRCFVSPFPTTTISKVCLCHNTKRLRQTVRNENYIEYFCYAWFIRVSALCFHC